jgi:hypothetical protein
MALAVALVATPAFGGVDTGIGFSQVQAQVHPEAGSDSLAEVRAATSQFFELADAIDAGFVPFALDGGDTPTCFDSDSGGMGVHYVRNVDAVTDPLDPEALVYELAEDGQPSLVAVEYVVPQEFVEDVIGNVVALPELHGEPFHKHASLPLYILHAWIWEENPEGVFADFNPAVRACPSLDATPQVASRVQ